MNQPLTRNGEIVLVTGATGYVGSVVAERLRDTGYHVRGVTRRKDDVEELRDKGIDPILGDVRDADLMAQAAEGTRAIVHTAAPNDPTRFDSMAEMIASAVRAVQLMVEVAERETARLLVTSGTSIYGHTGGQSVDESAPLRPMPGTEQLKDLEARLITDKKALIIRLGVVYGRRQSVPMRNLIAAVGERGRLAVVSPDHRLSIVEVDALADLYLRILEARTPPQVTNAVSAVVGWPAIMQTLMEAAGVSGEPERIGPEEAMALGGPAMFMPIDMAVSADLARSALGWLPTGPSFRASLLNSVRTEE